MGSPISLNYGLKKTVDYNWLIALVVDEARNKLNKTPSPINSIGINPIDDKRVIIRYTLKDDKNTVIERVLDVPTDFNGADSMYALQERAQSYGATLADNILDMIVTQKFEEIVFGKE